MVEATKSSIHYSLHPNSCFYLRKFFRITLRGFKRINFFRGLLRQGPKLLELGCLPQVWRVFLGGWSILGMRPTNICEIRVFSRKVGKWSICSSSYHHNVPVNKVITIFFFQNKGWSGTLWAVEKCRAPFRQTVPSALSWVMLYNLQQPHGIHDLRSRKPSKIAKKSRLQDLRNSILDKPAAGAKCYHRLLDARQYPGVKRIWIGRMHFNWSNLRWEPGLDIPFV